MHSSWRFTCRNQTGCTCLCPRLPGMQPCPSPLGCDSLAQPLARHGRGKAPMLLLNGENKKPLPTLACVQQEMDEHNRHVCRDARVPKQRHPKRSQGAPGEQFLVKPFIQRAQTSVHTQHCLHRETRQRTQQRVAVGTWEFGDATQTFGL